MNEVKMPKLVVTRGDGVPLPDQAAAVAEFKRQCLRTTPPSAPVGVEGLVQRLADALAMYDQNRTTMQSLAGSVSDFLHCYHSHAQQPTAVVDAAIKEVLDNERNDEAFEYAQFIANEIRKRLVR